MSVSTEHRVVWHYVDGDNEPVAVTSWTSADDYARFDESALKHAAREGVVLWSEGEPLEDADALYSGSGHGLACLDVEYLPGASLSGGGQRAVTYRIETRDEPADDDDHRFDPEPKAYWDSVKAAAADD